MNTTAPTRPAVRHRHCVMLTAGPAAAAEARGRVRAAICTWDVRVDVDVAVLLASELVTNAIRQEAGGPVMLAIACSQDELRVDVHDTSHALPVPVRAEVDAEAGRGLVLVDTLSDEWGWYQTPSGKAVYFRLGFG
jgi:anti-sigma regulatory factor (Ser/Thr protein kinase)